MTGAFGSPAARVVERVPTGQGELVLRQCGTDFEIICNGMFLMDTRDGRSERLLVEAALAGCASGAPRVLIGGLGVGFSLMAAAQRADAAAIDVVEISADIIRWHDSYLRHLTAAARSDPRVAVINADITVWLPHRPAPYDAICLDVDNGPNWTVQDANQALYSDEGLLRLRDALSPGGCLAVWSAAEDPGFEQRLRRHFSRAGRQQVPVPRGEPDVIYTAQSLAG